MSTPAGDPQAGLADLLGALRLELTPTQVERLLAYLALLQRWNAVYNLTAVRDPAAMRVQHLADCLAVVGPLRREIGERPVRVLDVGSGGGLPAVVLAVAFPGFQVTSVDSVGKKAAFVRQVAGELRLTNLAAVHGRVEMLEHALYDVVTARAFSSLANLVQVSNQLLAPDGLWMAMKGRHPGDELATLPPDIQVFHVEQIEVPDLHAERCLVWMRRADRTAPRFL